MKRIIQLFTICALFGAFSACNIDAKLAEEAVRLQEELSAAQEKIASMETATTNDNTGLIHTVFFWLKKDEMSEADMDIFKKGVQSLSGIETVEHFYVGEHADTEARGVVDHSYDYALIVHFKDQAGQDAYQPHPIHLKFVEDCEKYFDKVIVYDTSVQ